MPEELRSDTTEKILTAAIAEFVAAGFSGARVDAIARRAGVNKATLYYQVGGKEALYDAVIERIMGGLADAIEQAVDRDTPPEQQLTAFIGAMASDPTRLQQVAPIMMREVAEGGRHLPSIGLQNMGRIVRLIRGIIEQGQNEGRFRPLDPFLTHMMIIGTFNFYVTSQPIRQRIAQEQRREFGDVAEFNMSKAAAHVTDVVLTALTGQPQS